MSAPNNNKRSGKRPSGGRKKAAAAASYRHLSLDDDDDHDDEEGGDRRRRINSNSIGSGDTREYADRTDENCYDYDDPLRTDPVEPSSCSPTSVAEAEAAEEAPDPPFQGPTTPAGPTISIDDAIEKLGMGCFQYVVLLASGLCFAADGMQVQVLSFLTIVLRDEWDLTSSATASLTSVLFAGALVGTLILGPLADMFGRRPVFLATTTIISAFGLLGATTSHYYTILATIFMVGFGVGGLVVPFDLLAEFLPAKSRGTNLLCIEYFWTVGCLYVVAVADWTLRGEEPAWRTFVALSTLPCVAAFIIGCALIPESARWLVSQGRNTEAMVVLRRAATVNFGNKCNCLPCSHGCSRFTRGDAVPTTEDGFDDDYERNDAVSDSVFPLGTQLEQDPEAEHHKKDATIADLFAPKWREITLRLWGTWCFSAFGYYGTMITTTDVFASAGSGGDGGGGEDGNPDQPEHHHKFDYGAIFVSSSAELVGVSAVLLTIDRFGRIPLQVLSYSLAGISVCSLCILAQMESSRMLLLSLGFCARVFEMSGTCVTWVSTAEILTTDVRSTGHSTANAMARIGAFFAPYVIADETGGGSLTKLGFVMLIVHALTAIFVSKLPETMGKAMGAVENAPASPLEATAAVASTEDEDRGAGYGSDGEHHNEVSCLVSGDEHGSKDDEDVVVVTNNRETEEEAEEGTAGVLT